MNQDIGNLWVILNAAVYFITFLFSLFFRNLIVSFIIFLYTISALASVVLYNYGVEVWNITAMPFIYLYIVLIIIIFPLIKFKPEKIIFNKNILKENFIYIFLFISFSGFIFILIKLDFNFNFLNQYNEKSINRTVSQEINFQKIYLVLPVVSRYISNVCIFLLVYMLCFSKIQNNKINILIQSYFFILILSMFNYILIADRAGIFFNFCMIFSAYFIFKRYIKMPKILSLQIFSVFSICVLMFLFISIDRFSNKETIKKVENSTIYYLINYAGQSFLNFNDSVFHNSLYSYGDITLSSSRMLIGESFSKDLTSYEYNWSAGRDSRSSMSVFHTLIGVFCLDFGIYGSFFILLFLSVLMFILLSKKQLNVDDLFILFIYLSVLSCGVISYRFYFFYGSVELLIYILIFFYLKYRCKITFNDRI